MVWVLEALLLVPHLKDGGDALLGGHLEPPVQRDLLHLRRSLGDAAGPISAALLGAGGAITHDTDSVALGLARGVSNRRSASLRPSDDNGSRR
jgi:hypothetical protein